MSRIRRGSWLVLSFAVGCAESPGTSDEDGTLDDTEQPACGVPLSCAAPSGATKQTICGQVYDLATNKPAGTVASALAVRAYDMIAFAANPLAQPLAHGGAEIDSCGRFRVTDVETTGIGPFIGLAIDDASALGPGGVTVTTAIAVHKTPGSASAAVEAWVVSEDTTTQWASSGGPALATGVFAAIFRAHEVGSGDPFAAQAGVTATRYGDPVPSSYFAADAIDRRTIDATATATGANGTVLIANAHVHDGLAYGGSGGLADPAKCRWHTHAGVAMSGTVFVQIFRPLDALNEQCPM